MAIIKAFPTSKKVQRDAETFLRLLGDCVGQWAFMDRALFGLTKEALGTDRTRAAIVFYSWTNIANHLTLADKLMKHGLSTKHFEAEWKPLSKSVKRHLDTRSIYAHHPIKRTGTSKNNRAFYYYSVSIEPSEIPLQREYKGLGGKPELLERDLQKHAYSLESW